MHCKNYSHFFSKKFQYICVSLDVNFNESLTNDIVSFEQLGPVQSMRVQSDLGLYNLLIELVATVKYLDILRSLGQTADYIGALLFAYCKIPY